MKSAVSCILSHEVRTKSSTGATLAGSAQPTQSTPEIGKARRCAFRCADDVTDRPSSVSDVTESVPQLPQRAARGSSAPTPLRFGCFLPRSGAAPPNAAFAITSAPLSASEPASSSSSSSSSPSA